MKTDADRQQSEPPRRADGAREYERGSSGRQASRFAFVVAFAALTASLLSLLAANESEWPIFVLGLGGLLAGRLAGVPDRRLAVLAFALVLLAWPPAMFTSPIPRATSTLSHGLVAALLAWLLAAPVRHRRPETVARPWSLRWFAIPLLVVAIGALWELGEWLADALFASDLALNPLDTVSDLAADLIGAVVGLALHDRASRGDRGPGRAVESRSRDCVSWQER